jgi:hypothetical protein
MESEIDRAENIDLMRLNILLQLISVSTALVGLVSAHPEDDHPMDVHEFARRRVGIVSFKYVGLKLIQYDFRPRPKSATLQQETARPQSLITRHSARLSTTHSASGLMDILLRLRHPHLTIPAARSSP